MIITIEAMVAAPATRAWRAWTDPEHVVRWNFASDDWHCPRAAADLRVGGRFCSRMEAKDGSMGFDFEGTYTHVAPPAELRYQLGDEREVSVRFEPVAEGVRVIQSFEAESELEAEQQRQGWQQILNNFAAYAASLET